ncbi:MAG: hypothetical protein JWQ81_1747 [Amycolatopsis sp.]|nr:hypothetical protein [Amycolatopsis sp.]
MRARMATAVAVVAVTATLLGGCHVAVSGSAGLSPADQQKAEVRAAQAAAVDGALSAMAALPAVGYHSTAKDASGKPSDLTLRVTKNGTVRGALPVDGQIVQLVEVAGQLYLNAPAAYWTAHGAIGGAGDEFATGWAHADPSDLTLDPSAVLAPAQVSSKLRMVFDNAGQLGEPVRAKLADGTEVFRIGTGATVLQVTAVMPYRVASFTPSLLDASTGKIFGDELRPEALTGDALKSFHTDLDGAVAALGHPFDSVAQVTVTLSDNKLDCNGSNGSCTTSVQVENSLVGGDAQGSSVHLVMTSTLNADSLGSQTCTAEASVAPNTTTPMTCTAKFKIPNRTAQYRVTSLPTAVGQVLVSFDAAGVRQKLAAEFSALGG